MKITKSKLRKIIKEEIELESLRNAISKIVREMDFKDKESFEKYKSQHKMRPGTKVNVAGKETTVSAASGDKDDWKPEAGLGYDDPDYGGEKDDWKPEAGLGYDDPDYGGEKDAEETRGAMKSMFAKEAEKAKDDDHWGPIYDKLSKTEGWEEMLGILDDEMHTQYDVMTMMQKMGASEETLDYIEDMPELQRMERG